MLILTLMTSIKSLVQFFMNSLRTLLTKTRLYIWSNNRMAFRTQVLVCDPASIVFPASAELPEISSAETANALKTAAHHLLALRQPVAFPTETVYGLGAPALDADASSRIFSTKNRPPDNPLIVHVSSFQMLQRLLPPDYKMPTHYGILMRRFWPGALTLLFPNTSGLVPSIITANHPTVAIRMPSHPVARALIAVADAPLAAPSANSSGKPSPTRAEHVFDDLNGRLGLILDGGSCGVGLESTVIDGLQEDGNLRVLRPGGITVEDIEKVLADEMGTGFIPKVLVHRRDYKDEAIEQAPTTPGMKYRHYSPGVPVTLLYTRTSPPHGVVHLSPATFFSSLGTKNGADKVKVGLLTPSDSPLLDWASPSVGGVSWHRFELGTIADPAITAQRLFDGFLTLEKQGVDLILIEEVDEDREGLAVMNRVRKAAGESQWLRT
jgi:L-threonylcarbamoyladenylate synthase